MMETGLSLATLTAALGESESNGLGCCAILPPSMKRFTSPTAQAIATYGAMKSFGIKMVSCGSTPLLRQSILGAFAWPMHMGCAQLKALMPQPYGDYPVTLEALVYSQVRGATQGLQEEAHVNRVVKGVTSCLGSMFEDNEAVHLKWLMRQVGLRGTDVRLGIPEDAASREVVVPSGFQMVVAHSARLSLVE